MRVLIATVTAGGGHLAAAAALEEAWRSMAPQDVVERVDLVKFFSPLHRKIHADGYVKLVEHAPELWGMVFKKTDDPKLAQRMNRLKRIFPSNSRGRFKRYVKQFNPDVVLCTHYLPLEILGRLKEKSARQRRGNELTFQSSHPSSPEGGPASSARRRVATQPHPQRAAPVLPVLEGEGDTVCDRSGPPLVVSIVTD